MKINAISANVYRTAKFGDCTNNGISARHDELLIYCKEGPYELDTDNLPDNFAMLKVETVCGSIINRIYPAEWVDGEVKPRGGKWYMMGGNYCATSDSRFNRMLGNDMYGAVAIHDRVE